MLIHAMVFLLWTVVRAVTRFESVFGDQTSYFQNYLSCDSFLLFEKVMVLTSNGGEEWVLPVDLRCAREDSQRAWRLSTAPLEYDGVEYAALCQSKRA